MNSMYTARVKFTVDNPRIWDIMSYRMYHVTKGQWLDKEKCKFELKDKKKYGLTKIYECNKNDQIACRLYWGDKSTDFYVKVLLNGSYNESTYKFSTTKGIQSPNIDNFKELALSKGCTHTIDGAIKVGEYILQEIKTNVKSKEAESMRYLMDYKQERLKEWSKLPPLKQAFIEVPTPNPVTALLIWTKQVYKGHIWDHKHLIKDNHKLKSVAVARKLPPLNEIRKKRKMGEKVSNSLSYWHKYLKHDYFYDVWSNIHYGYVALACGFDEKTMLSGANLAQFLDNKGSGVKDAEDDVLCIKIGFKLYHKFGTWAEKLTVQDILTALENENLTESRESHICFHPNKSELMNED